MIDFRMLARATCGAALVYAGTAAAADVETLLFIRHAEKPEPGLGQLSCKGLNRALALGVVLARKYGKVDAVYAPSPQHQKEDGTGAYDYVRPLATVEPAAIRFGLPVHADFGYKKSDELVDALLAPEYRKATVLVAWEHHQLDALVPRMVKDLGGDTASITDWAKDDFDSIWRVTITRDGADVKATFSHDKQGLDGQPDACPD